MLPLSMKDMLSLLAGESGNLRYHSLSHLNRAVPLSARMVPFLHPHSQRAALPGPSQRLERFPGSTLIWRAPSSMF